MPTRTARALALLCALAALAPACRDEQAGPRRRPQALGGEAQGGGVRTLAAPPADLTYRSGATWADGAVEYLGSKVSPAHPRPGESVELRHYFVARRPAPRGYGFFAHVVDAASGQMLVNADHELQEGAAPLGSWPTGRVVEDVHRVQMPPVPARLVLGFWRGDERLAPDQARSHDGQRRVLGPPLGAEAPLPEYHVKRVTRAPVLDGVLAAGEWDAAEPVVLRGSFDGRPVALRTEARLLRDDANLYVAFDVQDPDVWGTYRKQDEPLYEQEVVEVFLDANADGRTYNELQVSPHGVHFDASFPARRTGMTLAWDSGMRSAVKVRGTLDDPSDRDEGWRVELAIPFRTLAEVPHVPPRAGDRWRFNLYRLEHLERREVEGQAFSPLFVGDFHALPRFGWLVFD